MRPNRIGLCLLVAGLAILSGCADNGSEGLDAQVTNVQRDVDDLRLNVDTNLKQIANKDFTLYAEKSRVEELSDTVSSIGRRLSAAEARSGQLSLPQGVGSLAELMASYDQKLDALEGRLTGLTNLNERLALIETRLGELGDQLAALDRRQSGALTALGSERAAALEALSQRSAQGDAQLTQRVEQAEALLTALDASLARVREANGSTQNALQAKADAASVEQLAASINLVQLGLNGKADAQALRDLATALQSARSDMAALAGRLATAETQLGTVAADSRRAAELAASNQTALGEQRTSLQTLAATLTGQTTPQLQLLGQSLAALSTRVDGLERAGNVSALEGRVGTVEQQLTAAATERRTQATQLGQLAQADTALGSRIDALGARVGTVEASAAGVGELRQRIDGIGAQVALINTALGGMTGYADSIRKLQALALAANLNNPAIGAAEGSVASVSGNVVTLTMPAGAGLATGTELLLVKDGMVTGKVAVTGVNGEVVTTSVVFLLAPVEAGQSAVTRYEVGGTEDW